MLFPHMGRRWAGRAEKELHPDTRSGRKQDSVPSGPVSRGRCAFAFPEGFGKVAHVLKSAGRSNFRQGQICFGEKLTGPLQPVFSQIADRRRTDGRTKTAQAFAFADRSGFRNISNGHGFRQMHLYIDNMK